MQFTADREKSKWVIVYVIVVLSLICFAGVFLCFGFTEIGVRMNIRWSARFSIVCFCAAFVSSSAHVVFQNSITKWLIVQRKFLGVSFALIHFIHLLFLLVLHQNFHPIFIRPAILELALGGLAYVFILLMFLTSFEQFSKLISKSNWKRLHLIGGYWILIIFSNSMLGRVVAGKIEYLPFGILVIVVWFIRLLVLRRKTRN